MSTLPIYAVSDLHLSASERKPMDKFGPVWSNHPQPLFDSWDALVPAEALVLIPGDLSWESKAALLAADYARINARPGAIKLLSPGNHDARGGWGSQNKARTVCAPYSTLLPVKSSAERITVPGTDVGVIVAAYCGALAPEDKYFPRDPLDAAKARKRFQRELGRLHAALDAAEALRQPGDALIVQAHYPPFADLTMPTAFSAAIERANARICVFGHLHNEFEHDQVHQGPHRGTLYRLVGCDALGMRPLAVANMTANGLEILV